MSERDYYALLGVRRTASQNELKKAYRALARGLHENGQPLPEFRQVAEAYATLSDPAKRRAYDGMPRGESVTALFEAPVGSRVLNLHFGGRPIDPLPGADVRMALDVPRAILASGDVIDVTLPADSACAGETIPLRVPPNSQKRRFVTLSALGASGEHVRDTDAKGRPGDLIILLNPV